MLSEILRSLKVTLLLALLLCGVYPMLIWVVGQVAFRDKANGSIVIVNGRPVGSELIGQSFRRPEYFHGRPSAAGSQGYDASSSSGSNLGPTNPKLRERVAAEVDRVLQENPSLKRGQIPVDLVTASGSGLDPQISPEAAVVQIERVARARKADPARVRELVSHAVERPAFGLLGERRVHVLKLNLALDQAFGRP